LVIYLHGALATTPGFQYVQQNAMAVHAKRLHFAVVLPTAPLGETGYVWPTSQVAQREQESGILASIAKARHDASIRAGHPFDETFVVGFSSGAYFGSSLAVREALNVDGYMILAGGSSWARNSAADSRHARSPVFVGVSAADPQTRAHSRSFGATLHALGWPAKIEERNAGHNVDWTFMDHGIRWLRERRASSNAGNQP
jgi:predicted esterase